MVANHSVNRKKLALSISMALVMGSASADFAPSYDLAGLDGNNGFALQGANAGDESGTSVSGAGDINGDGIDDLIIGAPYADTVAANAGASYLVFGSDQGFPDPLNLSTLNSIVINGESVFDYAGAAVSTAGDINGDGIDDLIIGAPGASPDVPYSGASYVVFGDDQGLPNPLNLSAIGDSNGVVFNGVSNYDEAGASVSAAGDINGDGIDDLIIGAPYANGLDGAAYVVFGNQAWTSPVNLSELKGIIGFKINSAGAADTLGYSVSAAGDINGDGLDDLVIGAILAGTGGAYNGAAYVVFGSGEAAWTSPLELSSLGSKNGFVINGVSLFDSAGTSVHAAGDVNGDTIDDLIIGAPGADPNGDESGASYVVFGSKAWPPSVDLSSLNGINGFVLNGVSAGDQSGNSVGFAGDINQDGFADVIIGAPNADPHGDDSGASYVVFGSEVWPPSVDLSSLIGSNGFVINGVSAGDNSGGSVSSAGDMNKDGLADIVTGARLADPNGDKSGASYVIFDVTAVNEDVIFADSFE